MTKYQTKLNALSTCITFIPGESRLSTAAQCNAKSCDFSTIYMLHVKLQGEKLGRLSWDYHLLTAGTFF